MARGFMNANKLRSRRLIRQRKFQPKCLVLAFRALTLLKSNRYQRMEYYAE